MFILKFVGSVSLTFWPFKKVDLQNCFGRGLPSSDQQPHHWPRLLQGLHCSAVNHFRHVHIVHTQHTVVYPGEEKILTPIAYTSLCTRQEGKLALPV